MALVFIFKAPIIIWMQIQFMLSFEVEQPCLAFIELCVVQFIYFGCFCNHARYLISLRIIKWQTSYQQDTTSKLGYVMIKLLKFLASWWSFLVIFLVAFILFVIPTVWISAESCGNPVSLGGLFGLMIVQAGFTVIMYIVVFFFDILTHLRLLICRCGFKQFFITRDPLCFRIEYVLYLLGPIFAIGPIITLGVLAFTYQELGREPGLLNVADFLNYVLPWFLMIPAFYYLLITTILPLILTICQRIRKKRVKTDSLSTILLNPEFKSLFRAFCEAEFSIENLLCWSDIQDFKKEPSVDKARAIHRTYLVSGCAIEVNVQSSLTKEVWTAITTSCVTTGLFTTIERELCTNMNDTYSRFAYTSQYMLLMKKEIEIKNI